MSNKTNNHRYEHRVESIEQKAKRLHYDMNNTITHYVLESCKNMYYTPNNDNKVQQERKVFFKYPKVRRYASV